jgi:tetratricopeptide (TPR) repeat protein
MRYLSLIFALLIAFSAACGSGGQLRSDSKDSFAYHYNLGMAAFENGDYQAAIRHFERSIRINPDIPRTHNDLGMCYLFLNDNARAVPHFERAIELDPSFAEAHNNLGIAFFALGRLKEAELQFQATLASPDYGTKFIPLYNLGNLYRQQGKNEEALSCYTKGLEDEERITPQYRINIHHQMGNTLLALKRYREAFEHYETVLVLNPRMVEAAFNAGVAAYEFGDRDAAVTMFSKAITIAPGTDWETRAREYLSKLER